MDLVSRFLLFIGLCTTIIAVRVCTDKNISKETKIYVGAVGTVGFLLFIMMLDCLIKIF